MNYKKYIPIILIMLSITMLLGTSYALLRSMNKGENLYTMNVRLLYSSDYGYSASNTYWTTTLYNYNSTAKTYSWMQQNANHNSSEWLLSPSSSGAKYALFWDYAGHVCSGSSSISNGARGVVNLISSATVLDAAGTLEEPYTVIVE